LRKRTGFRQQCIPLKQTHQKEPDLKRLLELTDLLIDGPFIEAKKDLTLKFRGSSNQRLIDMNRTRQAGEIVLLKE